MKRLLIGIMLATALLVPAFGINIRIPSMQVTTMLFAYNGKLVTQTQTEMDLLVEGGYKFAGNIVIGFDGVMGFLSDPSYGQVLPPLSFKALSLEVRDIFGAPLTLSYFLGVNDYLCYGNDFPRLFGTGYIEPSYRAFYYSPLLSYYAYEYRGIHRVNGNGIKVELQSPEMPFGFMLYVYQDHNFVTSRPVIDITATPVINLNVLFYNTGLYSADARFLFNTEVFKAEIFAGGTVESGTWTGYARFGALAYVGLGAVDFLLIGGLPQLDFVSPFDINLFYILFESRINAGPISIIPSAFMRPARYLQEANPLEEGRIDFNLTIAVFNPRRDPVSFGVEGNLATAGIFSGSTPAFQLNVLPFIAFATPGVFWEIKVGMTVWDSTVTLTMDDFLASLRGGISIKAEF
jgi:hypothetical protein